MAAASANYGFCAPRDGDTWYQPWDFIPSLQPPPAPERSEEEIAAHFDALFGPLAVPAHLPEH